MKRAICAVVLSAGIICGGYADDSLEQTQNAAVQAESTEAQTKSDAVEAESEVLSPVETTNKILQSQAKRTEQIKAELGTGSYTMEEPYVALDPYGVSPLTALLGFTTETEGNLEVIVKGKDEQTTLSHTFSEVTTEHRVPIYGLYADINNEVTLNFTDTNGTQTTSTVYIQTAPLPEDMPELEVVTLEKEELADGLTMASSAYSLAYDANCDIRWFLSSSLIPYGTTPICKARNGNLIFIAGEESAKYSLGNQARSSLYEMDFFGHLVKEYIVDGAHHEIQEMPNGDLLVAAQHGTETIADYIVQIDRETGEVVNDFDVAEIFQVEKVVDPAHLAARDEEAVKKELARGWMTDWFHNNSAWYDETDNSVLICGKAKDVILKVDAETKEIIWIFGDPNISWADVYADKFLTPIGDNFEYSYGSHSVKLIEGGDLLLFDNGDYRSKDPETALPDEENYSRGVRYEIDNENKTIKQVWEYGKERGSELLCNHIGDVDYLGDNAYLVDFGAKNTIVEVKDNKVVCEVRFQQQAAVYRAEKEELYDETSSYVDLNVVGSSVGSFR